MDDAFTSVWARSESLGVSLRRGAFALAHARAELSWAGRVPRFEAAYALARLRLRFTIAIGLVLLQSGGYYSRAAVTAGSRRSAPPLPIGLYDSRAR